MTTRILCTGGGGYIGSVLVPELLRDGYTVTVLDRFREGNPTLADCCQFNTFMPIRGDVRDHSLVKKLLAQADIIIPLAAVVGAPACDRDKVAAITTNRDAIVFLTKNTSSEQQLIYPNTNSSYGAVDGVCTEQTPLSPLSLYARMKAEAEETVLNNNKASVVLRISTVFGMSPKMRLDLLLNDFVYRALTDKAVVVFEGSFQRNFIHVRDVAKAFVHVINNYKGMCGEAYNVVLESGNISKLDLCKKIQDMIPGFVYTEAPIGRDPDSRNCIVSGQKMALTGYCPEWTLERGIQELICGLTMLRGRRLGNV